MNRPLRDMFDAPNLAGTDDRIANGEYDETPGVPQPLAPFTAQRIDYSLHRLSHYTATSPSHFQNYVLFTNYQFYVDEFGKHAREVLMANVARLRDALWSRATSITRAGEERPSAGNAPGAIRKCRPIT